MATLESVIHEIVDRALEDGKVTANEVRDEIMAAVTNALDRWRQIKERAEADLMDQSRTVEALRADRDRLKAKLAEAEPLIADLEDARVANMKRMVLADASIARVRRYCASDPELHPNHDHICPDTVLKLLDGEEATDA